jgi:U3 small nucleolar ribonucleoprotein component
LWLLAGLASREQPSLGEIADKSVDAVEACHLGKQDKQPHRTELFRKRSDGDTRTLDRRANETQIARVGGRVCGSVREFLTV